MGHPPRRERKSLKSGKAPRGGYKSILREQRLVDWLLPSSQGFGRELTDRKKSHLHIAGGEGGTLTIHRYADAKGTGITIT